MSSFDWYPILPIKIANVSHPNERFQKEAKVVELHFDTGAEASFISLEYLQNIGILSKPDTYKNQFLTASLNTEFHYITSEFKVALVGESSETPPAIIPLNVVKNFNRSPFTRGHGLLGRDIMNHFNATIELNVQNKKLDIILQDWSSFESEVANLFRSLGIKAHKNYSLAGNQIDVFLKEETASGKALRTIVECKFYKKPAGIHEVRKLQSVFEFSKDSGLADHAILVASSGFTKDAYLVAEASGIELLEIDELRHRAGKNIKLEVSTLLETIEEEEPEPEKLAFVIMPFKDEFRDIYMLGVRDILSSYGYTCTRVDEVEFIGRIMDKILDLIKSANLVIAEVTEYNPNVYYELGIAHALNKNVVLCTKESGNIPFDIRDLNHIVYSDIVDLREKLSARIQSLVNI